MVASSISGPTASDTYPVALVTTLARQPVKVPGGNGCTLERTRNGYTSGVQEEERRGEPEMPLIGHRRSIAHARMLRAQAQEIRARSRRLRGASDREFPRKNL
jgi:hypothetical protein